MDGIVDDQRIIIEDDGFPNMLSNAVNSRARSRWMSTIGWAMRKYGGERRLDENNPLADVMVWLGAGVDGGDGRLRLKRPLLAPWSKQLGLDWRLGRSLETIEAVLKVHRQLSEATGGRLQVPAYWRFLKALVTVHPLGGCGIGNTRENGVVDHRGEVFGYPNLFVSDGAIMPRPIGRNPAKTIAALAERSVEMMNSS